MSLLDGTSLPLIGKAGLLAACLGCAQVLGIPDDPALTEPAEPAAVPTPIQEGSSGAPTFTPGAPEAGSTPSPDGSTRPDGALPSGSVGGLDSTQESSGTSGDRDVRLGPEPASADAGAPDAGASPPAPGCEQFERVPVDVVFIVDNSGSMPEEAEAIERALPAFAERLEDDAVDYRIILLSRHRAAERSASQEASTSLCVAAPLSGLSACPSDRPALGPRFFHYSIKIDADDSFTRALEAFSSADPFELTASGWSEWLRPRARTLFIELTDADSALGASAFVAALQASAPERFGTDPARPEFVFHAVTGVAEKTGGADIYFAAEPIETAVCSGTGSNPDNAGVAYQELSRLTGGLRLSICPAAPFTLRLTALAADVALRSIRECD